MHSEWNWFYRAAVVAQRAGEDGDVARIEHSLAELLRLVSSARVHEARVQALGLTITRTEYRFLSRLMDAGPQSVSTLAAALDVSQPTASRSLRQLEGDRLVARRPDMSDGRVAIYEPTAKGRRIRKRLQDYMHEQLTEALADLPVRRRRDLSSLLEDLVTRLHGSGQTRET